MRKTVDDWDSLANLLKEEFQPPDYDERLWDEIKNRTQGLSESIGIYYAVMINLFARLSEPISDEQRIKLLLRNIDPYYQKQLSLTDVTSENQLLKLRRKIEKTKASIDNFVAPSRNTSSLEPDLAYNPVSRSRYSEMAADNSRSDSRHCWNCQQEGHISKSCSTPAKIHCYRCDEPNVTKASCHKCNKRSSGNFNRRR